MQKSTVQQGRPPSGIDSAQMDIMCAKLRGGNYFDTACRCAGVAPATCSRWMTMGAREDSRPEYRYFWNRMKEAESIGQSELVFDVAQGVKNWQSRAWLLERRWPDRWGHTARIEQTVTENPNRIETLGQMMGKINLRGLTDEEVKALKVLVKKAIKTDAKEREEVADSLHKENVG